MATSKVTVHFPCSIERLWHTVTDLANTAWRSDLAGVEVLDKTRFVELSRSGYATVFTVTACEPFCFWAFTMENGNMSGSWETVTAKRRWMRPFVPGYLKRQQKLYLDDLQRELQKGGTPHA